MAKRNPVDDQAFQKFSPATRALHFDRALEPGTGVAPAIMQSATYFADESEDFVRKAKEPLNDHFYARHGNPTSSRAALIIADLEGKEAGMMFASGMAAMTTTVLGLVRSGDHVIAQSSHYIGTTILANEVLGRFGIQVTLIAPERVEQIEAAIRPNTKLVILETPVNPTMKITDLASASALAINRGIVTVCDNTFASPINQRPGDFGIDVVIHSATKYLGGHHDLLGGVAVCSRALLDRIWDMSMTLGGLLAPMNAWLVLRGLRTLALRVKQHNANGLSIARFLETHSKVKAVYYPGLESHPQHRMAATQMSGFGGLLSFEIAGGLNAGRRFIEASKLFINAGSLGGVDSLVIQPAAMWSGRLADEVVQKQGVSPGLIRLAAGIEDTQDLLSDLDRALECA